MTQTAAEVYRDYETTGVPASGPHKPIKAEIRALLGMYESLFGSVGLGYATRALLYADLNHAANTLAIVYADPNPAYNGIYQKSGASGSGSWARVGDTPNDVIRLTVTGGTANNILATSFETPTVPGDKLYLLTPTIANTGPTTINVNGSGAFEIRNALGASLAANTLLPNIPVLMVDHYHVMVSMPVDATGVLDDVLAAADAAQDSADAAAAAAAALGNQVHQYDTRAQAIAATIPVGVKAIKITRFATTSPLAYATYIPVGAGGGPMAFQEAGGHWWQLDMSGPTTDAAWFGVDGLGADYTAALQAIIDALPAEGGEIILQGRVNFTTLDLHGKDFIRFRGVQGAGQGAGADQRAMFYSTAGAIGADNPAINCRGTNNASFHGLQMGNLNSAFNGTFISYGSSAVVTPGTDAIFMCIEDCTLFSYGASSVLLELHGATDGRFIGVHFFGPGSIRSTDRAKLSVLLDVCSRRGLT